MKKNKNTWKSASMLALAVAVASLCGSRLWCGQPRLARLEIPFQGNAKGGTLVLGFTPDPHSVHLSNVSIRTSAGESADSVVKRLAREIVSSDAIFANVSRNPQNAKVMLEQMIQGSTLSLMGRVPDYILAGTETGLGIPRPPLCLSCSYDKESRTIKVRWINPSGDSPYDTLYIGWRFRSQPLDTLGSGGGSIIPNTPTCYVITLPKEVNDPDTDIWIRGLRHETPPAKMKAQGLPLGKKVVPSDATAIHLTTSGCAQEETYGIPFFAGIAPNWMVWSTAASVSTGAFEQGSRYAGVRRYAPVKALSTMPYYQVIKAPPQGVSHGIYRKFLGLTPGHTYRISACVNTLAMDSVESAWAFSLCAAHNGSEGKDLTSLQLAGLAAVPDGSGDSGGGRIASYGPGNTTRGAAALVFTGDEGGGQARRSHITLPPGTDTITVWVRLECSDAKGQVAFSGARCEDISAIENPKSPAEIRAEERKQETDLAEWIEKASR